MSAVRPAARGPRQSSAGIPGTNQWWSPGNSALRCRKVFEHWLLKFDVGGDGHWAPAGFRPHRVRALPDGAQKPVLK